MSTFFSIYRNNHDNQPSELHASLQEVLKVSEELRKSVSRGSRRGASEDPFQNEITQGLTAALHQALQCHLNIQARQLQRIEQRQDRLDIEEHVNMIEWLTEFKARKIQELIAASTRYVTGTGSEFDYIIAETFKQGVEAIMNVRA